MGQTGRNRVLVIDDDTTFANLLTMRLESVGYEIEITTDGTTALQAATERHPDLVILDLRLPDRSGLDVCKELRRIFHPWEVPILMLGDVDQPIAQLRGFACGADAYLTKPFDSTELFKTVALLLGQFELTS